MMNTEKFYQWDINQRLVIEDANIKEVHFSNVLTPTAIVMKVYEADGKRYVDVPDELLTQPYTISAYASCGICVEFDNEYEVIKRAKPDDYNSPSVICGSFVCSKSKANVVVEHNMNKQPTKIIFYAEEASDEPNTANAFTSYTEVLKAEATLKEDGTYSVISTYCSTSRFGYYTNKSSSTAMSYKVLRQLLDSKSGGISVYNIKDITTTTFTTPYYLLEGMTYYWIAFR